jgi:hypothetical protein
LRIALPWLLALAVVEAVWPQLGASLGQAWLWQLGPPIQALLGVLLVRAHLLHLLPQHPRTVTGALTTVALVGAGLSVALTLRSSDSLSSAPYMSTLPLPAVRLGGTVSTQQAVQAMGPMADQVARRAQKARANEDDESAESAESSTE